MMKYKGYQAKVEVDPDSGVVYGRVIDTRDVIYFEATDVEQLKREFEVSINDYLTMCAEHGEDPDRPYSGNVPLRISPAVHRAAALAASAAGKSLNVWLGEAVEYHLTP